MGMITEERHTLPYTVYDEETKRFITVDAAVARAVLDKLSVNVRVFEKLMIQYHYEMG